MSMYHMHLLNFACIRCERCGRQVIWWRSVRSEWSEVSAPYLLTVTLRYDVFLPQNVKLVWSAGIFGCWSNDSRIKSSFNWIGSCRLYYKGLSSGLCRSNITEIRSEWLRRETVISRPRPVILRVWPSIRICWCEREGVLRRVYFLSKRQMVMNWGQLCISLLEYVVLVYWMQTEDSISRWLAK